MPLTNLAAETQYFFEVESSNAYGSTTDDNGGSFYTFTTDAVPTTINISNVLFSDITSTTVTVTWDTDVLATSRVERDVVVAGLGNCPDITTSPPTDDNYCTVWDDQELNTSHFFGLTNLKPNTTLYAASNCGRLSSR